MITQLKDKHVETSDLRELEPSAYIFADECVGGGANLYAFASKDEAVAASELAYNEAYIYTRDEAIDSFCDDE